MKSSPYSGLYWLQSKVRRRFLKIMYFMISWFKNEIRNTINHRSFWFLTVQFTDVINPRNLIYFLISKKIQTNDRNMYLCISDFHFLDLVENRLFTALCKNDYLIDPYSQWKQIIFLHNWIHFAKSQLQKWNHKTSRTIESFLPLPA